MRDGQANDCDNPAPPGRIRVLEFKLDADPIPTSVLMLGKLIVNDSWQHRANACAKLAEVEAVDDLITVDVLIRHVSFDPILPPFEITLYRRRQPNRLRADDGHAEQHEQPGSFASCDESHS